MSASARLSVPNVPMFIKEWSAPGFARSDRLIAGGRCCLAGPGAIERAAQLAHVDLNEGVLSKGRETLGEPTPRWRLAV